MNDQGHVAPGADILHHIDKSRPGDEFAHRLGQGLDHIARGDAMFLGDFLDNGAGILGEHAFKINGH